MVPLLIGSASASASELVAKQGPWATECTPNIGTARHSCRVVVRFPGSVSATVESFEYSLAEGTFIVTVAPAVSGLRAQVDSCNTKAKASTCWMSVWTASTKCIIALRPRMLRPGRFSCPMDRFATGIIFIQLILDALAGRHSWLVCSLRVAPIETRNKRKSQVTKGPFRFSATAA